MTREVGGVGRVDYQLLFVYLDPLFIYILRFFCFLLWHGSSNCFKNEEDPVLEQLLRCVISKSS